VLLYGQTRIFYTMSRDGLLPSFLAQVHTKFKTPWLNTIIVGIIAAGFAGFRSLDDLSDLSNVGSLAAFALVCLTVIYLRFSNPNLERPFRAPLFYVTAPLGAAMCVFLLMSLMAGEKTRNFFLIYLIGGIAVYFIWGFWFSKLNRGEPVEGHEAAPMELPH
jgi:basic amino acid/polyamine antiporter, APA family